VKAELMAFSKQSLAEKLECDKNGALAAEGLLMIVRHPNGRARGIIGAHLADDRINQFLYKNSDFAKYA
jgi:hypothetical protein